MTSPREVIARRRAERAALVRVARAYLAELDLGAAVLAAVVVGSVARGDFHDASDVDVIVVADGLPDDPAARWSLVAPRRGLVQPVAWTPSEWRVERRRRNPLVEDALAHGVWLVGSPDAL
jgi:uncharacterized protein